MLDIRFVRENPEIVKENIELSKQDWDSFETSWDFKTHPLLLEAGMNPIQIDKEQKNNYGTIFSCRYRRLING